jgi:hypothetical protein
MKRYRVTETFKVNYYTYVHADSEREALAKLARGEGETNFEEPIFEDWDSSDESTLECLE